MYPILLKIGEFTLPSYYTMMTLGFLALVFLGWREAKRVGLDPDDFLDVALYMLLFGLIGARLLHVIADGFFDDYVNLCLNPLEVDVPSFIHVRCAADADCVAADAGALCHPETGRCHPARDCFAALKFWHGGLAYVGGLIAAVIVAVVLSRRRGFDGGKMFGLGAFCVPLGSAFGRLGCLLSGCCFGQQTDGPLGIQFAGYVRAVGPDTTCPPRYDLIQTEGGDTVCAFGRPAFLEHVKHDQLPMGADHSLAVHPTQAYEAAYLFAIFAYIYLWRRKRVRFASQGFWEFCILYGVCRFVVEFFRADDRGLWFGDALSTSQIISIPIVAFGAWRLIKGLRAHPGPAGDGSAPSPEAA